MALMTAVTGGFGLIVIALACYLTGRMSKRNELPLNGTFGIRTKTLKQSDEAWRAGHEAAVGGLTLTALIGTASAILPILLAFLLGIDESRTDNVVLYALAIGYLVTLGILFRTIREANAAAGNVLPAP